MKPAPPVTKITLFSDILVLLLLMLLKKLILIVIVKCKFSLSIYTRFKIEKKGWVFSMLHTRQLVSYKINLKLVF